MPKVFIKIFFYSLVFVMPMFFASTALAAYDKFTPGSPITISEPVYNDDYTPYTGDCTLSVQNPDGTVYTNSPFDGLGNVIMDKDSPDTGRRYKIFTPSPSTAGVWPATISCGTPGTDLSRLDKSFIIGGSDVSNTDIATAAASATWNYHGRSLDNIDNIISGIWSYTGSALNTSGNAISNIVASVWGYASGAGRSLTTALLGGSSDHLALQSDVASGTASINGNITSNTSTINNSINAASSSLGVAINNSTNSINSNITSASSTLGATITNGNASVNGNIAAASSSLGVAINNSTNSINSNVTNSTNSINSNVASGTASINGNIASLSSLFNSTLASSIASVNSSISSVNASISSINSSIGSIASNVWGYTGRSLDNVDNIVANIASNVWSYTSVTGRSLTTALLGGGGNLALQSDVTSSTSSINGNITAASSSLGATITNGNASVNGNIAAASSSLGVAINNSTNSINSNVTNSVASINGNITAASSSLGVAINNSTASITGTISSAVSSINLSIGNIASNVWGYTGRSLDNVDNIVASIASGVWSYTAGPGRSLTTASLPSGSLALQSDVTGGVASINGNINAASSSLGIDILNSTALINGSIASMSSSVGLAVASGTYSVQQAIAVNNAMIKSLNDTNAVWDYLGQVLHSGQIGAWASSLSDTDTMTAGTTLRAKVYVTNQWNASDAYSAPVIKIYDPNRNLVASTPASMTKLSTGIYEFTYAIPSNATVGQWETIVDTQVQVGQTIETSDYWTLDAALVAPMVAISSITSNLIPNISANVNIKNEGTQEYEYHYYWCVVPGINDSCTSGNALSYDSRSTKLLPGKSLDPTVLVNGIPQDILNSTVPDNTPAGNYYFKLNVLYGDQTSAATKYFAAVRASSVCGDNICNGTETCSSCSADCGKCPVGPGGGGGGGGEGPPQINPLPNETTCNGADFNHDHKVNSTDFSILLAFWKTISPFKNSCVDINGDKKVNSVDFSILMYQWGTRR